MHLHPINNVEIVLLCPPVIGATTPGTAFGDLPRLDVHGRQERQPEPLALIDSGDRRLDAGELAGRWAWPIFTAVDPVAHS